MEGDRSPYKPLDKGGVKMQSSKLGSDTAFVLSSSDSDNVGVLSLVSSLITELTKNNLIDENHDITKILDITIKYVENGRKMPKDLDVNVWLINDHHATFYVYLPYILESILNKNPGLVYNFVGFIDRYLNMHFDDEIMDVMKRKSEKIKTINNKIAEIRKLPTLLFQKSRLKSDLSSSLRGEMGNQRVIIQQQIDELSTEISSIEGMIANSEVEINNLNSELAAFIKQCDEHKVIHDKVIEWWNKEIKSVVFGAFESGYLNSVLSDMSFVKVVISKISEFYEIVTDHIANFDMKVFKEGEDPHFFVTASNRIVKNIRDAGGNIHPYNNESAELF